MSEASEIAALQSATGNSVAVLQMDAPDASLRQATIDLWGKVQEALPFAPQNYVAIATMLWDRYGRYTYPLMTFPFATPEQRAAWTEMARAWQPLTTAVLTKQIAAAKQAAVDINADVDLWERVRRVTAAVASFGLTELVPAVQAKWKEITDGLAKYRRMRSRALQEAADPSTPPSRATQLRDAVAKGDSTIMGKIANATGDGKDVNLTDALAPQGLGAGPIAVFASLGMVTQLAILAGIAAAVAYSISLLSSLGVTDALFAVGDAMKWLREHGLGPMLGFAILAGVGFYIYKRTKG